ncbi:hypothetical protein [Nocardia sp. NPDC057030]|uniref:hypothetical protein n=1 Tax=unclassified Nocardia TaxID=2637762 RepID=UPI00362B83A0
MRLPYGVTGFWMAGQAVLPEIDQREFRSVCHTAARLTSGWVTCTVPAGWTRSFVAVSIAYRDHGRAVLCNLSLPLVAVAEPIGPDEVVPVFVCDPQLTEVISCISQFRVLTPTELATPLAECDLSELGEAELAQIRYWKPETVGETVFNWWD